MAPPPETFLLNFILTLSMMRHTGNMSTCRIEKQFTLNPTKMLVDEKYARDEVEDMAEQMEVPYLPIIHNKVTEICRHIYEGRASRMVGALHVARINVSVHQGFVRDVSGEFDIPHAAQQEEFVVDDDFNVLHPVNSGNVDMTAFNELIAEARRAREEAEKKAREVKEKKAEEEEEKKKDETPK